MSGGPNPSGLCQCGCGQATKRASCSQPHRGVRRGEFNRFCHGHAGSKAAATANGNAFWIEQPGPLDTPCHIWQGAVNSKGYPSRGVVGSDHRSELVHRAHLEARLGRPLLDGHQAHHECVTRRCVNGLHLSELTPLQHKQRHRVPSPRLVVAS